MKAVLAGLAALAPGLGAAALPTVASINLCTDQLVLSVADASQILSLSWLAADPEESMLAAQAAAYPQNFGAAEELLRIGADIVIAGSETSPFTRQLLRRLGSTIVEVAPATSLVDVARNLRQVGAAIDRVAEAELAVSAMQDRASRLRARAPAAPRSAVVVRPGGFTIGRGTLAYELLELAGLENSIAELDRWGSLSIETLLRADPAFIVVTRYRADEASLANSFLAHPALAATADQTRLTVAARHFACGAPASLDAAASLLAQMAAL
jgi:iron complex transport system substrate-binding protein